MRKTLYQILLIMPAVEKDERLREVLAGNGYELIKAQTLGTALQKITECDPDLVICNHDLGEHSGFTIYKALHNLLSMKEIPFMLYMDEFDKNEVMIGLEVGIDNFIIKPYDKNALVKKIRKYTTRRTRENTLNTERFILYFNTSPYAKFITENKRLINVNEAFSSLTGIPADDENLPDINHVFDFSADEANELEFRKCMSGITEYAVFRSVRLLNKNSPRFDIHMVYSDYFGKNIFTGEIIKVENQVVSSGGRNHSDGGKEKPDIILTEREKQVLELSSKGHSIKQIANELGVSARTVEKHRANIMEKTQSSNIIEAIYYLQD